MRNGVNKPNMRKAYKAYMKQQRALRTPPQFKQSYLAVSVHMAIGGYRGPHF